MASSSSTSAGSPCGACKFLRRKCLPDCIFAPYFCSEQGPATFAAIHKVFGASNLSKLLLHVPLPHRPQAVLTVAYQAQARIRDPVYGCVSHIFALQQQVAYLQTQLMQTKAQIAQTLIGSAGRNMGTDNLNFSNGLIPNFPNDDQIMNLAVSPDQSSLESAANNDEALFMMNFQESCQSRSPEAQFHQLIPTKLRPPSCHGDVGELQALALRMMRN